MTSSCSTLPERDQPSTGELELTVARRGGASHARHQFHQGALRILRPIHLDGSGQVCYTVVNPGGAFLGADHYRMDITVEEKASLLLTTQSATKVYRTPQGPATQDVRLVLGPGAVLENIPDQLIIYRDGSYRQTTRVIVHPRASLVSAEVITPGWSPDGERFRYQELRLRTEVRVGDAHASRIFAVDQLRLEPGVDALDGVGQLEGHSHIGQLLVVDWRVDTELVDVVSGLCVQSGLRAGVSSIGITTEDGVRGLVVRSLGHRTEDVVHLHENVTNHVRHLWRGQGPLALRKY